jgi:hypothetical protein
MKKWFQWQFDNQCKSDDWNKWNTPIANLKDDLSWFFDEIKQGVASGETQAWFENVFHRADWTRRTAAGSGLDPMELWDWCHEYPKLMDEAGILKINKFKDSTRDKLIPILSDKLNLKADTINFYCHNEAPGQIFPMHFDRNKWNKFSLDEDTSYDTNYGLFLIFFDDWKHGQAFQQGTAFLKWKSGDVFTWDHESTPHGSANLGYEDRYTLLVNGVKKT